MLSILVGSIFLVTVSVCVGVSYFFWRRDKHTIACLMGDVDLADRRARLILWEMRDLWDHLPASLPVSGERRELAQSIGHGLPLLLDPQAQEEQRKVFDAAIKPMIEQINDPVINRLWESGSPKSIAQIPRTILFQAMNPAFDPQVARQPLSEMTFALGPRPQEELYVDDEGGDGAAEQAYEESDDLRAVSDR